MMARTRNRILILGGGVLLVGLVGSWAYWRGGGAYQYRTMPVTRGDLNLTISATGTPNAVVTVQVGTLSALGGTVGIAVGIGASSLISYFAQWSTLVSPGAILLAFVFSGAVGVFFGYYPARKAALLDPIVALRYD
jgi:hypothetical protein